MAKAEEIERRRKLLQRFEAAKLAQSSFRPHWLEISQWVRPRTARFLESDKNDGSKKNDQIINNTAAMALGVAQAGISSGLTNESRPWFKMGTQDSRLFKLGSVKAYLHEVETVMYSTFSRSNFYDVAASMYGDMLQYGPSTFHIEPDEKTDIRCKKFPVGQFYISRNARGDVDCFYREFKMSARQLAEEFGKDALSDAAKRALTENRPNEDFMVLHAIEPNENYEAGVIGWRGKRYTSCWLEVKAGPDSGFLREKGFEQLQTMAPCWQVDGEDDYGTGPGMTVLGDVKGLQLLEKEKLLLIQKAADPPMTGPAKLKSRRVGLRPGDFTGYDANEPKLEPAMSLSHIPAALGAIRNEIAAHEYRINRGFHADLWLMLLQGSDTQKTAREIAAREAEKMLQLGPVLGRLFGDFLKPTIEIVFSILNEMGKLPPPPPELAGQELKVEFVSVLAQAMKLVGITSYERLTGFVIQLASVDTDILDKVNTEELVEDYAARLGVPPDIIRTDEEVQRMRDARAQAAAQQAAAEQAAQQATALQKLSQTDLAGDNAASRLVDNLGGPAPGVGLVN